MKQTDSQVFALLKNQGDEDFSFLHFTIQALEHHWKASPFFQPKNLCTTPSPTSSPCETEWPLAHPCVVPKKPICFVEANSSWMVWNISWKPTMVTWVGNGCTDAGNTNGCGEEKTVYVWRSQNFWCLRVVQEIASNRHLFWQMIQCASWCCADGIIQDM